MVPESHPLQQFFMEVVGRNYAQEIGLRNPAVIGYVSHLLTEFCDADQLFKIRNTANRPLSDVGEMLMESDPVYGPAPSFDRERQVRKHIGDYTLFMTGIFRDYARQMQEEMIREIELARPRYVVSVGMGASWYPRPESDQLIFTWANEYLNQYYSVVAFVNILSADRTDYYFGDVPQKVQQLDNYILIYERKSDQ